MRLPFKLDVLPVPLLLLLSTSFLQPVVAQERLETDKDGLVIELTKPVECSRRTQRGDVISVHYRGTLLSDGTEFDASYNRGAPFSFVLGAHRVILGWDHGLLDMCIGEERKLIIPPELGYGDRAMGAIKAGSTLVFETKLMGIKGVEAEAEESFTSSASATLSQAQPSESTTSTLGSVANAAPTPEPSSTEASSEDEKTAAAMGSEGGPKSKPDDADNGECRLLGPFALIVQGALGLLAMLSLVFKRWREKPRRPLKIWFFDASKQIVGSILLHLANLFMSMLSSGDFDAEKSASELLVSQVGDDGSMPNPCSFYLLNLAIDTTIGIPILVIFLRVLHALFLRTYIANPPESIKSGNYGHPPRATWWMKQSLIYFVGLFLMKLCVFFLFQALPWLAWVGDWALRWTEGNEALQIAFVMFIFPVCMNAIQYYIIDSFIKDNDADDQGGFQAVPSEDSQDGSSTHERRQHIEVDGADDEDEGETKSVAATTERQVYDPHIDGEGSSVPSPKATDVPKEDKNK